MSFLRPELGEVTLLVYRECACGWWCATGEGAVAPVCPSCGRCAMPLGGGKGQFGPQDGSDRFYGRRERGLGFVAYFTQETRAVRMIGLVKQWLGISPATNPHLAVSRDQGPYAAEQEITSQLAEREIPAEALWERMPPWFPEPDDVPEDERRGGQWTAAGLDAIGADQFHG